MPAVVPGACTLPWQAGTVARRMRSCSGVRVMASLSEIKLLAIREQGGAVMRAVVLGPRRTPILVLQPSAVRVFVLIQLSHDAHCGTAGAEEYLKTFRLGRL